MWPSYSRSRRSNQDRYGQMPPRLDMDLSRGAYTPPMSWDDDDEWRDAWEAPYGRTYGMDYGYFGPGQMADDYYDLEESGHYDPYSVGSRFDNELYRNHGLRGTSAAGMRRRVDEMPGGYQGHYRDMFGDDDWRYNPF